GPGPGSGPSPGARRRGGRRRGASQSREKILEVARVAFPANGYTGTSLRGIARDAGVDPSLVVQQFGSKAGLFAAVVEWPFDAHEIAAHIQDLPIDQVGEDMARRFISHWDRDEERSAILSLIFAALEDPAVAVMFRQFATDNLILPALQRVGADRPQLRAALLASQLIGLGLARYVLAFDALSSASSEELITALGAILQDTCMNPLLERPGG
ncbi:MAG: TetR family transcriptional regulator, partial [Conexibacteraceae bacterium]|nr:TetR family transcriptional regulator [Conexibacteraceae bacterium]